MCAIHDKPQNTLSQFCSVFGLANKLLNKSGHLTAKLPFIKRTTRSNQMPTTFKWQKRSKREEPLDLARRV
jgi:hypothetical protein